MGEVGFVAGERPILASIDTAAFRHNYLVAKSHAPQSKAWCVVKANAYGHGLLACAEAVRDLADGFALLDLCEARALREAGFQHPILLLEGFFDGLGLQQAAAFGLSCVVHADWQVEILAKTPLTRPIDVWLKLNTGMHRLGFAAERFESVRSALLATGQVRSVTAMTHFAGADELDTQRLTQQWQRFQTILAGASGTAFSCANSAALLRFPHTHGAWVRPGIMLYGSSPMPQQQSAENLALRPVMHLQSRIIARQTVQSGEAIGYGATFVADRPMRVGVVACGYADGYPRHAVTGTPICVAGQRTRTLGRVSMDMLVCDLTDLDSVDVGAAVTLWGPQLAADEVAAAAGTVSYELFCALAGRVTRRIVK